ncbi:MAG: hypothetical protein HKO56_01905 [Bacteroidia bacterium]|nr:hypothetical protein [Bacteroidia bacterium]NNM15383.1 hypothetical protein [Bacteroidia bacterium]
MNNTLFNYRGLIIILSLLVIIPSCKKDKLGISQKSLIGHWLEVEPAGIIQFGGTNHEFYFNNNGTFALKRDYWTDVVFSDPCQSNHSDYVVGTFAKTNNQFSFTGKYSNAQFTVLQPNVCGETDYAFSTTYTYQNGILTLNSGQEPYFQIALHKQ